jgi:archaellum biogenesis protein FlaJ (TadC family)
LSKDDSEDKSESQSKFVKALTSFFKEIRNMMEAEVKTPLGIVNILGVVLLIILAIISPLYLPYLGSGGELFDTYGFIFILAVVSAFLAERNRKENPRFAYAGVD